jgi:hypothetical protein
MDDTYLYAIIAILVILIIGLGYYFLYYKPCQRKQKAKKIAASIVTPGLLG